MIFFTRLFVTSLLLSGVALTHPLHAMNNPKNEIILQSLRNEIHARYEQQATQVEKAFTEKTLHHFIFACQKFTQYSSGTSAANFLITTRYTHMYKMLSMPQYAKDEFNQRSGEMTQKILTALTKDETNKYAKAEISRQLESIELFPKPTGIQPVQIQPIQRTPQKLQRKKTNVIPAISPMRQNPLSNQPSESDIDYIKLLNTHFLEFDQY